MPEVEEIEATESASVETIPTEPIERKVEVEDELDSDGWLDLLGSGRIRKRVIDKGPGERGPPKTDFEVDLNVTVFFQDREIIPKHKLTFFTAQSEVIQAVDLVTVTMCQGEVAEVIADPEFAYGKPGLPEKGLPANAAVRFVIEMVDFREPIVIGDLSIEQKMTFGMRKKARGNDWYTKDEFSIAIQCYRKAAEFFDDDQLELDVPIDRFSLPEDLQQLLNERIKTLNNIAQCQMKIEAFDSALGSLRQVLKLEPNNEKALYRKAKVLEEKLSLDEAIGILRRVTRLYPDNKLAQSDLARLSAKQKKNKTAEQLMSKKMLGLDKTDTSRNNKGSWLSLGLTSGLVIGSLGALVGAAALKFKYM